MSLGTLGKIGMADKMSVDQLQQAVQSGSLPAYIGIPLIQEKMKEQQEAQSAQAAQNTPQNSVAEQIMAEATQKEMGGLGDLPTNLPEQYAAGGIIGYDEGGDVTQEEYDDQLADAEFDAYAKAMINRTPNVEKGLRNAPSMSYSQVQGQAPRNAPVAPGSIDSLIEKYAAKHGVPVELARNIAMAEGGGKMNLGGDPRSSAKGPYGIIDSTWKSLGGTAENRNDPEANIDLGIKLIRQNAEAMKGKLGQDPSYGNVYAAHHFGSGVGKMLANADPRESIESGLSRFESPSRIKSIMQSNPHLRGKTVGEVESFLNTKGGQGTMTMAQGGIASIPRFDGRDESLVKTPGEIYDTVFPEDASRLRRLNPLPYIGYYGVEAPARLWGAAADKYSDYQKNALQWLMETPKESEKRKLDESLTPTPANGAPMPGRVIGEGMPQPEPTREQLGKGTPASNRALQIASGAEAIPSSYTPPKPQAPASDAGKGGDNSNSGGATTEAKPSPWQELRDQIAQGQERRKAQKEQDMWLALMAGGLGAMAGQSQYAGVNIGQGAMHGLQQYGASRREAAKDETADIKNLANIARYEEMGKYYNDQAEANAAKSKDYMEVKNKEIAANALARKDADIIREAKARYGDKIEMMSPADQVAFNKFIEMQKATPGYMELQNTLYGDLNKFKVLR